MVKQEGRKPLLNLGEISADARIPSLRQSVNNGEGRFY